MKVFDQRQSVLEIH